MSSSTDRLIAFLRQPDAYPNDPADVEEIQTHISWVFLADEVVYKIKKPVSLGFLDFSTLEKRKHFCEQEVRLNRRLCGDVYLGVIPISEAGRDFRLENDDDVVEYAVKMRRLQGGAFADALVDEGRLERQDLDRVTFTLSAFYNAESPTPEMASWGRTEKLAISTDENFEQTEAFVGELVSRAAFDAIRASTNRFFDMHATLVNERRAGGHILDCHGDLHLDHLYLKPDEVCIYDCIEFNERFRTIDAANDVAFLAMDLDFHGRPDLSVYLGEQMADRLEDPGLLAMLGFYKTYRAVVRAKVEGMRSEEEEVSIEDRREAAERARAYFRLALRYACAGSSPLVLVLMGRVGTGKSTVAAELAGALGCDVISSDRIRKSMAGVALYERGSEQDRRRLYEAERTRETYDRLITDADERLRRGQSVVLDATYSRREHRDALREAIHKSGAACCFVELTASDETIRERLRRRGTGERSISDAREEDFEMLTRHYEAPDDLEDAFHFRVPTDAEKDPIAETLRRLVRLDFA